MHWVASDHAGPAEPGWHPDPLDAQRLRWWDGSAWTARVARLDLAADAISWHADVPSLPAPGRAAEPPPVPALPLEVVPTPYLGAVPTLADAVEHEAPKREEDEPAAETSAVVIRPKRWSREDRPIVELPNTRRGWAILAAAVALLVVGGSVGAGMLDGDDRPSIGPATTIYADQDADFRFRYPKEWRIEEPTGECPNVLAADECVRVVLEIGPDVSVTNSNTLQVRSFNTDQPLDALHEWVTTETQIVVEQIPTIRLQGARQTVLDGAPAFRAELVDSSTPTTRLVVYEGRTTSSRALVVTLTVRDPRTAPTDEEFERLLATLVSN
ncbi:MAG: DUF2510 domain-containing protein [Actinobacteria bacterium]|nr:DUF2510 domain-containing protein [Actinomycetota bacterium]